MAERNVLLGILAVILGLIVIAFPLITVFSLSVLTGLGIIFIGIWLIAQSFPMWESNKGISILSLILGILGIVVGIGLFGKILVFSILVGMLIYLGGIFLIIAGILALISGKGPSGRWGGILGIVLGILYIFVGIYALNPIYLATLIGFFLIIAGIMEMLSPAMAPVSE